MSGCSSAGVAVVVSPGVLLVEAWASGHQARGWTAEMKIASWNLNEERRLGAWQYLTMDLHADLALVQEALPNALRRSVHRPSGIAGRDGKARRWGSAVVALSDDVTLEPVGLAEGKWRRRSLGLAPLECVSRGHVAIARVEAVGLSFTAISAYGLMEFGYASGTLLRTIADLEPLLDDPVLGDDVIIAGDWNIGTWWTGAEDAKYARREGAALRLLEAYGFEDCLDRHLPAARGRLPDCRCDHGERCRHVRTYRKSGSTGAYQDDYLFATRSLAERMLRAEVDPAWDWNSMVSDHAPLIAEVDARPA